MDWINGTIAASTDQGNISYALPSISPNFWIRSEDSEGKQLGGPHTPEFEQAARTEEAHGLALRVGKVKRKPQPHLRGTTLCLGCDSSLGRNCQDTADKCI